MLELEDIQGFFVQPQTMPFGRYLFFRICNPEHGRRCLASIVNDVTTAGVWSEKQHFALAVGLTYHGLEALSVSEGSLATFPEIFREGIFRRADLLGDTGASAPENWDGRLGTPDLHGVIILFANDRAELDERTCELRSRFESIGGFDELWVQDAAALPGRKEHFGYRDGITDVIVEGSGRDPVPGADSVIKPGEFILGYSDEAGEIPPAPQPEVLGRNGTYMVYRKLAQHVAAFREFLVKEAGSPEEVEWLAAKLMGRWRSGAPLVLSPTKDNPELGQDPAHCNNFNYAEMDPRGFACPIGSHIRRANPRDSLPLVNRSRVIRRGLPYGPTLPESAPEDGADRGVAIFFVNADIERQFELIQRIWINNREFQDLDNEKDPFTGDHDGTCNMTIQRTPFRKRIPCIPRFTTVKGGGYFFVPGVNALRYLVKHRDV